MYWVYIWLGVVVASLILEFVTMELVSIWISVGSFLGMILALCGVRYEIQIVVAVIVSIACIFGLRKITLQYLNKNQNKTNADALIGKKLKLKSDLTSDKDGTVVFNGIVWNAKCENESENLKKDELVEVVNIQGNKLIIKKIIEIKDDK